MVGRAAVLVLVGIAVVACTPVGPRSASGDPQAVSAQAEPGGPVAAQGFDGRILLDEYEWFLDSTYLGVTEVRGDPISTVRLVDGSNPRRLADGRIIYRQACGVGVHQIAVADTDLRSTPITPCSSTVPNPVATDTDFYFPSLDPTGRWVAVQAEWYVGRDGFHIEVVVFDVETQEVVARLENLSTPIWLPDGRLLMSSGDWFWAAAPGEWVAERFPGELTGPVGHPAVSPDGTSIAFEYNQQIWAMNIEGTEAEALILGDQRLRFPAWSPDGSTIVYLSTAKNDQYEPALFFVNLTTEEVWAVRVADHLSELGTVNGPLTWTE